MEEEKTNSAFSKIKEVLKNQKVPELNYVPVNDLLNLYIAYDKDLKEVQARNHIEYNFNIYLLRDIILFFDKYDIFDLILEGIDEEKVNKIIERINKVHRVFIHSFDKIFNINHENIINGEMIIDLIIFFVKTIDLIYKMLGNIKNTKKYRDGNMLVDENELTKYQNKYYKTFFSPEYKLYDMEMMFDNIINELINSGDTEERIRNRNAIYSTYKYCKLRANNG